MNEYQRLAKLTKKELAAIIEGKPEKQSIDMVLLTPENACQYTQFAPNGNTSCE